jgi:phosphoadenosine phosphosulfate reductase
VRGLAVLEQAAERHDRIAIAVSFQKESSVIVDLAQQVMRTHPTRFDLFTLDTGVLFDETRDAWRRFEDHFGVEVAGVRGEWPERLWETDPDACCAARKTVPLRERLAGHDAWVTGLRREQSASRAETPFVAWDGRHGLEKLVPLADWTEREVWAHILERGLPYHELHDRGYASIGCAPCTQPGELRDGRWSGTGKVECGIHA